MTSKHALSPAAAAAAAAAGGEPVASAASAASAAEQEEEEEASFPQGELSLPPPPLLPAPAAGAVTATEPDATAASLFSAPAAARKYSRPRGQHASMPWQAAGCISATTAR